MTPRFLPGVGAMWLEQMWAGGRVAYKVPASHPDHIQQTVGAQKRGCLLFCVSPGSALGPDLSRKRGECRSGALEIQELPNISFLALGHGRVGDRC